MTVKSKIVLLIFMSWFLSSGVSAKESPQKISNDSNVPAYTLDEIIVTGQRSLYSMRKDFIKAEEIKFKIFNSLNSTDDFDITCEWRAPLGTRIKQWSCDVGYMEKARSYDAFVALTLGIPPRTEHELAVEFAGKTRALNREMVDLAVKHPELATAMIKARVLQYQFRAERIKQTKNSIFRFLAGNPKPDKNDVFLNEIDFWQDAFLDHSKGAMSDDIWKRWDSWCKSKLHEESYRKLWAQASHDKKYAGRFIAYINTIISED